MRVCSLGSGSKGNATLIQSDQGNVLVDCGFGLRESLLRLQAKGLDVNELTAILVSHEHGDHSKGVGMLARKADVPVFCSAGTYRALLERNILCEQVDVQILAPEQGFALIGLEIFPLAVPHDARETFQFIFKSLKSQFGILTDTGSITPHLVDCYRSCEHLLVEFNHDTDMLWSGPYPQSLKERVSGRLGHLSNHQAIEFLQALDSKLPKTLLVSHVSEKNNCLDAITTLLNEHFEIDKHNIVFSDQEAGCDWFNCH